VVSAQQTIEALVGALADEAARRVRPTRRTTSGPTSGATSRPISPTGVGVSPPPAGSTVGA
jgi:hypothetical protein